MKHIYFTFLTIIIFSSVTYAEKTKITIEESKEKIILNSLFESIGMDEESIKENKTDQKDQKQILLVTPTVIPSPTPQMSLGEKRIKEQLEQNRQALKNNSIEDIKKSKSLKDQNSEWLLQQKKLSQQTKEEWKIQIAKTRGEWEEKRKLFLSQLKTYKENLFEIEAANPVSNKILKTDGVKKMYKAQFHVIPHSLDIPIQDQGKRSTCAAFAGARAIESLPTTNQIKVSEQYLYWASKPYCQISPCSQKGSWTSVAFESSKKKPQADIPLAEDCPYENLPQNQNETQIPLTQKCANGKVKIKDFSYISTLDETVQALNQNYPIIAGFTLNEDFYTTQGFVSIVGEQTKSNKNEHAGGHAMLIVGYIQLPEKIQPQEGKLCFIVANSWGEGFGAGGHACLSEKWVLKHRVPNAFIALKEISLKEGR